MSIDFFVFIKIYGKNKIKYDRKGLKMRFKGLD